METRTQATTEQPQVCLDCGTTTLGFRINWRTTLSLDGMYELTLCPECDEKNHMVGASLQGWINMRKLHMERNAKSYVSEFFAMKRRLAVAKMSQ